ncbi:DotA/TraY family protein [Pseudomonas luteola]
MRNNIRKFMLGILLAFSFSIITPVFAADTAASTNAATAAQASKITEIFDVKTDYSSDLAQKWLKQLFGSFIFTESGTAAAGSSSTGGNNSDITILSQAIGFSNVLAMIFGIVVVSYLFIAGSMNTAHHGEALGKNWSSIWLPVRLATGFGLIMPAGSFGGGVVSTIQALTIWIILVGSNAGNVLWNSLTSSITSGVAINSNVIVNPEVPKKIASMLSCTYNHMNATGSPVAFILNEPALKGASQIVKGVDQTYGEQTLKTLPKITYKEDMRSIDFASFGACGTVEFSWVSYWTGKTKDQSDAVFTYLQTAKDAGNKVAKQKFVEYINDMITEINKFQKPYPNGGLGGSQGIISAKASSNTAEDAATKAEAEARYNTIATSMFAAGVKISAQLPLDIKNAMVTNTDFTKSFAADLKKGGWGSAGLWYMRVGSVQNMIGDVANSFSDSVKSNTPNLCPFGNFLCKDSTISSMNTMAQDMTMSRTIYEVGAKNYVNSTKANRETASASGGQIPQMDLKYDAAIQSEGAGGCDADSCSIQEDSKLNSVGFARSVLGMLAQQNDDVRISGSSSTTDTSGIATPFATAAAMGNMSINIMQTMYTVAAAGSAISSMASMAGPVGKIASGAVGSIVGSTATVLFGIGSYFGAVGIMLAFVIPFMPALLWMMMMIGYLLAVIEAMIASPFAVIMMVTPEGEGISGQRMERAIGLLALCVLRPSLMVMGLVASIVLSSVSFSIFNQFFWYTASTNITGSILTILVLIGMYTMGLSQVCKYSISIMSKLPDQILEWMNMSPNRQLGEHEAAKIADEGAKGGVEATKGVMDTVSRDMKSRLRKQNVY